MALPQVLQAGCQSGELIFEVDIVPVLVLGAQNAVIRPQCAWCILLTLL